MHWTKETLVVDPRPSYRYRVVGNRYIPKTRRTTVQSQANEIHVSIVLLHATSMFKETFEPFIDHLFESYSSVKQSAGRILLIDEAWSIECPNHGQSAILNAEDMKGENRGACSIRDYADATYAYLRGRPGGHDLGRRKLILVGHSIGAVIIPYLVQMAPKLAIYSAVLGDPQAGPPTPASENFMKIVSDLALSQQDVWQTRDNARKSLETHPKQKGWTRQARELFLKYALIPYPSHAFPEPFGFDGVTLACAKDHEAFMYRSMAQDNDAYDLLAALYASDIPVHLLYDSSPRPLYATSLWFW
ncbi:hypothetical protein SISNIDRAFT_39453 [Sistotremastrum niveocremeum HHB9708]|uniref:AB hydrolase-1 domain-containing protein n=1 Tax=Sistotremastrum niveocremeum HHB9708 TaxID=1314777 RepID=A0A164VQ25_9AGAM|nr:hypothetical protein SISNIDRAFT_39453 [Sistotremastrum niveocremeum HHB9708]